jgi:hypothetical protein
MQLIPIPQYRLHLLTMECNGLRKFIVFQTQSFAGSLVIVLKIHKVYFLWLQLHYKCWSLHSSLLGIDGWNTSPGKLMDTSDIAN